MKKNNNSFLVVQGIVLIVYLLIIISFVQSSTAQRDDDNDDSGWWDARDYYNQFDRSTDYNYDSLFSIFKFFIIPIIVVIIIWQVIRKVIHHTKDRRYFSSEVKREVLQNQNYKCAICKRSTGVWDYDHKNGDRSNNKLSNCQALCPNCHAKKTRGLLKTKEKSNRRLLIISVIIIFLIIIYFLYRLKE